MLGAGGGFLIVPLMLTGVVPCTYAGTWIARRVPPRILRATLIVMLILIAARSVQILLVPA